MITLILITWDILLISNGAHVNACPTSRGKGIPAIFWRKLSGNRFQESQRCSSPYSKWCIIYFQSSLDNIYKCRYYVSSCYTVLLGNNKKKSLQVQSRHCFCFWSKVSLSSHSQMALNSWSSCPTSWALRYRAPSSRIYQIKNYLNIMKAMIFIFKNHYTSLRW